MLISRVYVSAVLIVIQILPTTTEAHFIYKALTYMVIGCYSIFNLLWLMGSEGSASLGLSQEVCTHLIIYIYIYIYIYICALLFAGLCIFGIVTGCVHPPNHVCGCVCVGGCVSVPQHIIS
jgi:hypothetical protein